MANLFNLIGLTFDKSADVSFNIFSISISFSVTHILFATLIISSANTSSIVLAANLLFEHHF
jgi:hypothetical protein